MKFLMKILEYTYDHKGQYSHDTHRMVNLKLGACDLVDRTLDPRSEGLGFDIQCWPCVEVLGKLRFSHST